MLKFYKKKFYPYKQNNFTGKKHFCIIGIGGNIGDTIRRFEKLFIFLKKDKDFKILQTSPILKNPPFGFLNQDDFYNAVLLLKTNLTPFQLLRKLQKIEQKFKRKRFFKNSPRTLDLDIIFYDKISIIKHFLIIPHKDWKKRESVVLPLKQLKLKKNFILRDYNKKLKNYKGAHETFIFHSRNTLRST